MAETKSTGTKSTGTMKFVVPALIGFVAGYLLLGYQVSKAVCQKCKTDPNYNICTDAKVDTSKC